MIAQTVFLDGEDDFAGWRQAARQLLAAGVPAEQVIWQQRGQPSDLFAVAPSAGAERGPMPEALAAVSVPKAFLEVAQTAILHTAPERFALLYALLVRLREDPRLLYRPSDRLVNKINGYAQAVRRDIHKMRGFVRFREVNDGEGRRLVAWYEPDFQTVRVNARFFVERFRPVTWSILTPKGSLHWDQQTVREGPAVAGGSELCRAIGRADPLEALWTTYYASTFNASRVGGKGMLREMPKKFWHNLPETAVVAELLTPHRQGDGGEEKMSSQRPSP